MIEREVKRLLTEEQYKGLLSRVEEYISVNNYYFTSLNGNMVRLRLTNYGGFELTLKRNIDGNGLIREEKTFSVKDDVAARYISRGIPKQTIKKFFDVDYPIVLDYMGMMSVLRGKFTYRGLPFELDKSRFMNETDYELECESDAPLEEINNAFKELGALTPSQNKRFRFEKAAEAYKKKIYKTVLFDLDGTIADTSEGIFPCFKHTFFEFCVELKKINLRECIGPPVSHTLSKYIHDEDKYASALKYFSEYYSSSHAVSKCRLYAGLDKLFDGLKRQGKRLGVITGKKESEAVSVLDFLGITSYFDFICGSNPQEGLIEKADIIAAADYRYNICGSDSVLIGDTVYDARAAECSSIDFIGVLYGFGTFESMIKYPHICFADTPYDLSGLFLCEKPSTETMDLY